MAGQGELTGPDLREGIAESELEDGGMLEGHVEDDPVLLVRDGDEVFAVGARCTHYGAPLKEGVYEAGRLHCPWHHACFAVSTGEPVRPPALSDLARWDVERKEGRIVVTGKSDARPPSREPAESPDSVVIVGAGAAGEAAAETLRRRGYEGRVVLIDLDGDEPVDRPNLSKDYLAGDAKPEWIPLRPQDFFDDHSIELVRGKVVRIDTETRTVALEDGEEHGYGKLLLATGAAPRRLPLDVPAGVELHYLRTLADADAIINAAGDAGRAAIVGAGFIGLEVAASLRARDLEVHVVAPEELPLEGIMGPDLARFIRDLHEDKGVKFHLGQSVDQVTQSGLKLSGGGVVEADLLVVGIGVEPRVELAQAAGLEVESGRGIGVDDRCRTSDPHIYAAGDAAWWLDPRSGQRVRIEHWAFAQAHGQAAARNILGADEPFTTVPFFWSQHYDAVIAYVGHAPAWDEAVLDGDPGELNCRVGLRKDGEELAVATIFRDQESIRAEIELARRA